MLGFTFDEIDVVPCRGHPLYLATSCADTTGSTVSKECMCSRMEAGFAVCIHCRRSSAPLHGVGLLVWRPPVIRLGGAHRFSWNLFICISISTTRPTCIYLLPNKVTEAHSCQSIGGWDSRSGSSYVVKNSRDLSKCN